MSKGVYNPDNYCPICGRRLTDTHKCPDATIAGIDGAETRARRQDDGDYGPRRRTLIERLKEGFRMFHGRQP